MTSLLLEAGTGNITQLEAALLERLQGPFALGRVKDAVVSLDVEGDEGWTLYLQDGSLRLGRGLDDDADTTIATDPSTMVQILEGSLSGIEAFVTGNLRVRGNLALSLRMSGSFPGDDQPARFPRAGDVRVKNVNTFYIEAGEGPPVLMLHGLGATNSSMLPSVWDLAADHRVIAPDMPGFGDSGKPLRSYGASFFAQWAIGFMDKLGIEKASIVGNSLGGRVALEAGLFAPDRIEKLVLLAPSPAFIRRREWVRIVRILRPEMALLPVPIAHRHVVRSIRGMFSQPKRLPDSWYESAADEFLRVFSSARGRISFFSAARQIYLEEPYGEEGFWDRLAGLRTPSLFVWGARDRVVPAKFARHVEKTLPNATSMVLDDCGHVPQFELPDKTNALIRQFIDG